MTLQVAMQDRPSSHLSTLAWFPIFRGIRTLISHPYYVVWSSLMAALSSGSANPPMKPGNIPRVPLTTTAVALYTPKPKHLCGYHSVEF